MDRESAEQRTRVRAESLAGETRCDALPCLVTRHRLTGCRLGGGGESESSGFMTSNHVEWVWENFGAKQVELGQSRPAKLGGPVF